MFLPSGLAYYESGAGTIPSYTPIIFSFKLYQLKYRDHDLDGILSKDERKLDPNINPLIRWKENPGGNLYKLVNNQTVIDVPFLDTDGDGLPNFFDIDDDGDNYITKVERKYTKTTGSITNTYYYPFSGVSVDDPLTEIDETEGIPNCGNTDFTSPTRLRKHLDKNCH
jgi:hypothetical protein